MRLSCNGCRVLRKGCSEDCSIRPCLEWIKSPESQANATLFLAKFYGRAGLLNLIHGGPPHLRPSIFKSLLHEACGRIVNPVHGSAGLVSTGSWKLCQAAVESVLSGSPISQGPMDTCADHVSSPFKACDIRHVSKEEKAACRSGSLKKLKNRTRFKRSGAKPLTKPKLEAVPESSGGDSVGFGDSNPSRSGCASELGSVETVEDTLAKPNVPIHVGREMDLELQLGLNLFPVLKAQKEDTKVEAMNERDEATWACDLRLGFPLVS